MELTPREKDKLLIFTAGLLAERRKARGLKLNYPEAVAFISAAILEGARDGRSVAELMTFGTTLLTCADVMEGVAGMIPEVQVEATFADGTKLVTVHHPIREAAPVEQEEASVDWDKTPAGGEQKTGDDIIAGEIIAAPGTIEINAGRSAIRVIVANTGDRPIQVGSHYHFYETNPALQFDRAAARGMRLNIPAGTAVRFEPGQKREIELIPFAGDRVVFGFNALVMGPLEEK